jgi:hypothetical protein
MPLITSLLDNVLVFVMLEVAIITSLVHLLDLLIPMVVQIISLETVLVNATSPVPAIILLVILLVVIT